METKYIEKVKEINKEKNLKYYILTMGCQLNENDSEKLCGMVEEMGYQPTEDYKEADLVIFNTCCVRENAEDKLFGKLGELKKVKETRGTIIAIGGCMMQEKHITDKIHESYSYTDIIFGTHTLQNFPEDLYKTLETKKKQQDILDIDGEVYEGLPIKRTSNIKASVTIMYGCNNFCTYCIVPYVRGRERSRHPKDILAEVEELAKEGYAKESIDKYLGLFKGVEEAGNGIDGICYIAKTLEGFLEEDVEKNLLEIINSVNAAKQADFKLVFDPTLVRGMSYYTGTIFEIAMPELGAACGGGGRYDKMVGKFTGQDVPACGFSIGFERIVLLLMESGFTVPMQRPKVAYLIEKGYPADKLVDVIAKAQEERQAGKQVLVVRMNKNKKFQKEKLAAEGYKDIVEFFNN